MYDRTHMGARHEVASMSSATARNRSFASPLKEEFSSRSAAIQGKSVAARILPTAAWPGLRRGLGSPRQSQFAVFEIFGHSTMKT